MKGAGILTGAACGKKEAGSSFGDFVRNGGRGSLSTSWLGGCTLEVRAGGVELWDNQRERGSRIAGHFSEGRKKVWVRAS